MPQSLSANYSEHDKVRTVKEDSQKLGEFLEWMESREIVFAVWIKSDNIWQEDELRPFHINIEQLLADFFKIDLKKLQTESEQMYAEIVALNQKREEENASSNV